jgi:type IV pilus assembly protein PilM
MAGAQSSWGIDIGTLSLKAIKLRKDGDRVQIEAFDVIDHDLALSDPTANRDEVIRKSLARFLERHSTRRDAVFVSVPGSMAFSRFVKLPPVEPKKVPEIVRFEAIQQIPFPLDQVNWDYYKFQAPDSPDVEVGIFAMKKDLVEEVLANFAAAGIAVAGVQLSPLAVYNAAAYDNMSDDKGAVIVDMGTDHTDLVVVERGLIWMRSINIGGSHFTDALSKSFKRPFDKAEELKKNALQSKYQKQIFQAMRPVFADLVADIQRSIGHYSSSHRESHLDVVVGMGNPFRLPNLQKYLQQELKMDVVRLDNFKRANAEPKTAAALNDNILSLPAAYGLAIQGLGLAAIDTNLLPVEIARKQMWKRKTPWFIAASALVVLGVASLGAKYYTAKSSFESTQDGAEYSKNVAAISEFDTLKAQYTKLGDTVKKDVENAESFVKLAQYRAMWPELTQDILASLPQAQGAKGPAIVITKIDSEFRSDVNGAAGASAAAPAAPAAAPAGKPGEAAPPPDSPRGFVVTITGYTTPPPEGTTYEGDMVVKNKFEDVLMARAPHTNENKKPYYFVPGEATFTGSTILPPAPGAASGTATLATPVWSSAHGPFWDVVVPPLAGIKPAAPVVAPGAGGGPVSGFAAGMAPAARELGPIDPFSAPDENGPKMLYNSFQFTFTFKVHVK